MLIVERMTTSQLHFRSDLTIGNQPRCVLNSSRSSPYGSISFYLCPTSICSLSQSARVSLDLIDMETGSLLSPMQASLRLCHPLSRPALPHFILAMPLQNDVSHIEIP
jgi:hypothetical protein